MKLLPLFLLLTACADLPPPEKKEIIKKVLDTVVDGADAAVRGDFVTAAITLVTGLSGAGFLYWRRKRKKKAVAKAAEGVSEV